MDAVALLGRPASLVTGESWRRCALAGTTVDGRGALTLAWDLDPAPPSPPGGCVARGLAVDRLCHVYRLVEGAVERLLLGSADGSVDYARLPDPVLFLGGPSPAEVSAEDECAGDFTVAEPTPALDPVGAAVDGQDRLFLADGAARTVAVIDLWGRRVIRTIRLAHRPGGLAARAGTVYVVLPSPGALLRLSATAEPVQVPLSLPPGTEPVRVAVLPDGSPVVLATDAAGEGWLVTEDRPALAVGGASDLVVDADGTVVVAPCPGPSGERLLLRRFVPGPAGWTDEHPLDATGYDGDGIVLTRDGRVGYFTAAGFRLAAVTRVAYELQGTCTTYRIDSGTARNRWGRVLLEASVPEGTAVTVATATTDEPDAVPSVTAPAPVVPVHRRPDPVTPWWRGDPCFSTFEAPVMAPPGRYLWATLVLRGDERRTPRVHEVRVEHIAHGLMRRLPGVFAADPGQAEFLHRYLATVDGVLHDLDLRSRCRDVLVDPHGTPAEALDWLASFLGLVLDDRWAENARRQLVAEITALYRWRGTVWALRRYLQLYLAGDRAGDAAAAVPEPVILEQFRLRRSTESYTGRAHRFTVLVPQPLDEQAEDVVRHVLETERPAHTLYDLCTVDAGLRVGRGAHLGISTLIGPTGAFERAVAGRTVLGRRSILGPPVGPSVGEVIGRLTMVGGAQ